MSKGHIPEKELKTDAFLTSMDKFLIYYKENKTTVQWIAIGALALVVVVIFSAHFIRYKAHKAQQAFDTAVTKEEMTAFIENYDNDKFTPIVLYKKGNLLYEENDYRQALESYEQIVNNYKDSQIVDSAYLGMGYAYTQLQEFDKARTAFETVVNNFKNSAFRAEAQVNLAQMLIRDGNYAEAKKVVDALLDAEPNSLFAESAKSLLPVIKRNL
ncbi:MAG: tetratricopeptide repeat protein [Candidatus Auribacterota bacterium]